MRIALLVFGLLLLAGPVRAQTIIIGPATQAAWTDAEHNTTFGTPPVAVVTKYTANLYLKTAVTGTTPPAGPPLLVLDFGKPVQAPNGDILGPPLKALVQPNVEYVMFLYAVGPSGTSGPSNASVPFGFPAVPVPAVSLGFRN